MSPEDKVRGLTEGSCPEQLALGHHLPSYLASRVEWISLSACEVSPSTLFHFKIFHFEIILDI